MEEEAEGLPATLDYEQRISGMKLYTMANGMSRQSALCLCEATSIRPRLIAWASTETARH